jgi:hypothetical protein
VKRLVFHTKRRYSAAATPTVLCIQGLFVSRLANFTGAVSSIGAMLT